MPYNLKWSERCFFLLFTPKPNIGYEINEAGQMFDLFS